MKSFRKIVSVITIIAMAAVLLSSCGLLRTIKDLADESISDETYNEPTLSANNNTDADQEVDADSYTLMVYFCASDLESDYGSATIDINEILYGNPGDKLNVVIQTGGTTSWQNDTISSDSVQRYEASSEGLKLLDDIGQCQMTAPETLSDFISYAAQNYPADRYGLILWDHGGGTLGGYGVDDNFDEASMDISQLSQALKDGGVYFDLVGFDCCLMGTIETAKAVSPYANYMIASEETEPGTGWYYTNFINLLNEDPGVSMKKLGNTILSDYTDENNTYVDDGVTLSLVDLGQLDNVLDKLYTYLSNAKNVLDNGNYQELSNARYNSRSYGEDGYDQIDIIDYINQTDIDGGSELKSALENAIILNAGNISGSNGLAMYYPYLIPEFYSEISSLTSSIGIEDSYSSFFNDFLSVQTGGQINGGGSVNPFGEESASGDYDASTTDWYDSDIVSQYEVNDSYVFPDTDELEITEKGDTYVLKLTDEQWDLITDITLQAYIDDGEGYLSLGSDNLYEFDDDGDLIIDYDYTWLYLNGALVSYEYIQSEDLTDGSSYSIGYIPALLNNETDIDIWLRFDNYTAECEVLGYREDTDYTAAQRGYHSFSDGDTIDFYFDYYDYDGNYAGTYFLKDNQIVYSSYMGLEVNYDYIGDDDTLICFWLCDIYGNDYWTEAVVYTD